ncbi:unnamed protein product [Meloidogyne enterolobii]|uniref:Uncharacterized protein n=1 Tax=Meloidogyne enterolobii TaxID=390850 RepID=A0ACB1AEF2_MELEN
MKVSVLAGVEKFCEVFEKLFYLFESILIYLVYFYLLGYFSFASRHFSCFFYFVTNLLTISMNFWGH